MGSDLDIAIYMRIGVDLKMGMIGFAYLEQKVWTSSSQ